MNECTRVMQLAQLASLAEDKQYVPMWNTLMAATLLSLPNIKYPRKRRVRTAPPAMIHRRSGASGPSWAERSCACCGSLMASSQFQVFVLLFGFLGGSASLKAENETRWTCYSVRSRRDQWYLARARWPAASAAS